MSTAIFSQLLSPVETLPPLVLTAGNNTHRQDVDAEFLIIESADEAIDVYLNKATRPMKMSVNDYFRMPVVDGEQTRFTQIRIVRRAGAAVVNNSVTITVGSGDYRRGNVNLTAEVTLATAAEVTVIAPTTLITPADVGLLASTNTLIFASNPAAKKRIVRNMSTTTDLRISTTPADLTAGKGKIVKAGEEWETSVSGNLYARSTGTPQLNLSEESF